MIDIQPAQNVSGKLIKGLTVGKTYDIDLMGETSEQYYDKGDTNKVYRIVDDSGQKNWYNDEVLLPLEKYRDLKLKELGV
jgi:hypothetical protein